MNTESTGSAKPRPLKVLVTGGHVTPALAVVDYVQSISGDIPEAEFVFVGRTHSRKDQVAVEATEVGRRQLEFVALNAPKFALIPWWQWPLQLVSLLGSVWQATLILWRYRPDVVLVFGGYLAVPIVMAAWLQRIPIVTHEQTRTVGLANRVIGQLATKVAVAFSESQKFFSAKKTQVTGNPMRPSLFAENLPTPTWFHNPHHKPLLVITGGSQGSQVINQVVDQILPQLLPDWCIVHQRGQQLHDQIPSTTGWYFPRPWLTDQELFWLWQQPTCVSISRAGANTVCELAAARVPAILVPLPFAYQDEQRLNARWLVAAGGAVMLEQTDLDSATLLQAIAEVHTQAPTMHLALKQLAVPLDATAQVWQLVQSCVKYPSV